MTFPFPKVVVISYFFFCFKETEDLIISSFYMRGYECFSNFHRGRKETLQIGISCCHKIL